MKKILQSYGESIRPVRIYLDELEDIIGFLDGTCEEIVIQCGNMLLDNLDELSTLNKELVHDLTIRGKRPYVSLDMKPDDIWLNIGEDTPVSRGLFEKIKAVLVRCRRPFTRILHSGYFVGFALGLSINGVAYGIYKEFKVLVALSLVLFAVSVFWTFYGFQDWRKRYTVVVLKHRIESPGFGKRNRDKIVLVIISALMGALITYFLK